MVVLLALAFAASFAGVVTTNTAPDRILSARDIVDVSTSGSLITGGEDIILAVQPGRAPNKYTFLSSAVTPKVLFNSDSDTGRVAIECIRAGWNAAKDTVKATGAVASVTFDGDCASLLRINKAEYLDDGGVALAGEAVVYYTSADSSHYLANIDIGQSEWRAAIGSVPRGAAWDVGDITVSWASAATSSNSRGMISLQYRPLNKNWKIISEKIWQGEAGEMVLMAPGIKELGGPADYRVAVGVTAASLLDVVNMSVQIPITY